MKFFETKILLVKLLGKQHLDLEGKLDQIAFFIIITIYFIIENQSRCYSSINSIDLIHQNELSIIVTIMSDEKKYLYFQKLKK